MPRAPVVPNRKIVSSPLEAHLRIVILSEQVKEIAEENVLLVFGDAVDALGKASVDVDRLPAGYSYLSLATITCFCRYM